MYKQSSVIIYNNSKIFLTTYLKEIFKCLSEVFFITKRVEATKVKILAKKKKKKNQGIFRFVLVGDIFRATIAIATDFGFSYLSSKSPCETRVNLFRHA